MSTIIERAQREDIGSVLSLLERHGLAVDGADAMGEVVVARLAGRIVGAAGLELYADAALLRSVVVEAGAQGQGLGQRLTEAALALAHTNGVSCIFLLTTTADGFFPRFGFERIDREHVPESVQQSVEFRSACPASAVVMRTQLGQGERTAQGWRELEPEATFDRLHNVSTAAVDSCGLVWTGENESEERSPL